MNNQLYSDDLENNILGSILTDEECFLKAREKHITTDMFYFSKHKAIYKAIIDLSLKGLSIDIVTLIERNKKNVEEMGGVTYISQLTDCVASTMHFNDWLDILQDYYRKRKILAMTKDINNKINELPTQDILDKIQKDTTELYEGNTSKSFEETVEEILQEQEDKQEGKITGLLTGINKLDDNLGGFHKTELITIFARSGVGKTTLSTQIASNMQKQGKKVMYVSNEMTTKEILDKIVSTRCNIEFRKILTGTMNKQEYARYGTFYLELASANNIEVIHESNINALISKIKLKKMKDGLDIVFIDYINLTLNGAEGENMTLKIGYAMQQLKELAMNENICVVVLAQAKQTVDKNNSNLECYEKMSNSDIQDSARIEQFSNVVISLYRNLILDNKLAIEKLSKEGKIDYLSPNPDINPNCCSITLNKSRYGGKTTFSCTYEGKYSRITNFTSKN